MSKIIPVALSHDQLEFIERQVYSINLLLERLDNSMLMYELSDLLKLQNLVNSALFSTAKYEALSVVFGDVFISENTNYRWVSVTFADEIKLAIFCDTTDTIWYPMDQFSKWKNRHLMLRPIYFELFTLLHRKAAKNINKRSK
jgi:hypothetical protein